MKGEALTNLLIDVTSKIFFSDKNRGRSITIRGFLIYGLEFVVDPQSWHQKVYDNSSVRGLSHIVLKSSVSPRPVFQI